MMTRGWNSWKGLVLTLLALLICTATLEAQSQLEMYGYFSTRYEKTFEVRGPSGIVDIASPAEWSYPYFNIMLQYSPADHFRTYINLNGGGAGTIEVRNFWGEYSPSEYLSVRVGKIYRKFGLYNEVLDAVPSYYGIEAPELFDTDHLIVSRTTTMMVYGTVSAGPGILQYSLSTDNGEGGAVERATPLGYDLRYAIDGGSYTVGVSGYTSGGTCVPDLAVGDGSPKSGVLPWMASDQFTVYGGFAEANIGHLMLQAEYWTAPHHAQRDPASILTILANTTLNARQMGRFLIDPAGPTNNVANVQTAASYTISTWYVRAGYSFEGSFGEVGPYLQWDRYSNPETIAKKAYGGDNEAGVADDGVFDKSTLGIVYRPNPQVAVKLDQSFHFYKAGGENVRYPEVRIDFSFIFGDLF